MDSKTQSAYFKRLQLFQKFMTPGLSLTNTSDFFVPSFNFLQSTILC